MTTYLVKRILQSLLVVVMVSIFIFSLIRFLPGDPILMYLSRDQVSVASPEQIAALKHEFGLDQSPVRQYFSWAANVLHGDLGRSIVYRIPVWELIGLALPVTMYIGMIAFILSIVLGIPLGILAAVRRGKWPDTVATVFANLGVTAPVFWVGAILVLIFGMNLGWLPIQGFVSPLENLGESLRSIIIPVICLTVYPLAAVARQTRSAMLEVIRQDYIRTGWAKGLKEYQLIFRHVIKNGLIPVIILIGLNIRQIFGGQVLIETVFNISGMGRLSISAIMSHDYAVLQGVVLVISLVVVFSNLLVDLSWGWIDPRIRYE